MPHKDREARKTYARLRARKLRAQCAMTRWAAREHRIAIRQPPPINELAWAAGCFEGEGTVTLTRAGRIMHVRPLVSLSSTDMQIVEFFNSRWPGNCRSFMPKSVSGNVRMAHTWNLNSGERIQCFLGDILPYVQTVRVRDKIAIVLEDIKDRGLYQQQPEVRARSAHRRSLIAALNAKGRASAGNGTSLGESFPGG